MAMTRSKDVLLGRTTFPRVMVVVAVQEALQMKLSMITIQYL